MSDPNFPTEGRRNHNLDAQMQVKNFINRLIQSGDMPGPEIDFTDVYVVQFTYILGNYKALVSTTIPDGMYYEVTYNKMLNQTYIDAYRKVKNVSIEH